MAKSFDISELDTNHLYVVASRRMVELHQEHERLADACEAILLEFPITPEQAVMLWLGVNAKHSA